MNNVLNMIYKFWILLKKRWKILFGIFILIFIGVLIGRSSMHIETIIISDSSATPIFTVEIDTTQYKKSMDSLWSEAKAYYDKKPRPVVLKIIHDTVAGKTDTIYVPQKIKYIATFKKDTVINDGRLRLKISLTSPIPIHPDSRITYNIISEYTEPIIPKRWYHDRFIIYTGVGLSSDGSNFPKPSFQIGIGMRIFSL